MKVQSDLLHFYGWRIVIAGIIILAVGLGMFMSTNSLFVIPVSDSLGVTRGQFTFHRTIITLVSACLLPLYGKVIQRFGVRKVLLVGALMLGLVTIGYSFAQNIWHFYVIAFVNGVFVTSVSFMVIGILVSAWFTDKKGLATGLAFAGSGLGGAVMIPIVSRVMETYGWRVAYMFMGLLGLLILLPVIFFLVKEKPEKVGLKPYVSNGDAEKDSDTAVFNISMSEALKTSRFWLLAVTFALISTFAAATNTHTAPFMTDLGYSVGMVSAIVSVFMLTLTFGKIVLGIVYDRFGVMTGNMVIVVCCLVFPIAALLSHLPPFPWVYAVAMGMASCGLSVPVAILIIRYFGQKGFPLIFSVFTMIMTIGPAISVPAMGAVHDITGSYRPAWIVFMAFSLVISLCLVTVEAVHKRRIKNGSDSSKFHG